ncbi:hypothetical protein HYH03_015711 [Edaphochlamys debaryana]|uniref:Uncharacterized protein n=1 Tax=Edaphochlamys debaryana TaxID=47281 RepID=A0A835XNR1_9CHLO|nr:hypothetical protein HYH03_015711 [Edaphochlamys debaryana]|eukprot:KAG2485541.1 hypothetical protein HYH03_015711 [Edaphochlamys debaryana]
MATPPILPQHSRQPRRRRGGDLSPAMKPASALAAAAAAAALLLALAALLSCGGGRRSDGGGSGGGGAPSAPPGLAGSTPGGSTGAGQADDELYGILLVGGLKARPGGRPAAPATPSVSRPAGSPASAAAVTAPAFAAATAGGGGRRRLLAQAPAGTSPSSPPNGQAPAAPAAADDVSSTCAVLLRYGARVGDPRGSADVPIFVGSWQVEAAAPKLPPVSSWVLGWAFGAGERLLSTRDVFSEGAAGAATNLGSVVIQYGPSPAPELPPGDKQRVAVIGNGTLDPSGPQLTFSFVGRTGPTPGPGGPAAPAPFNGPPSAPLRVAPVGEVFFNNLRCAPLPVASAPSDNRTAASAPEPVAQPLLQNPPRVLQVDYLPISYIITDTVQRSTANGSTANASTGGAVAGPASVGRPAAAGSGAGGAAAGTGAEESPEEAGRSSSAAAAFLADSFTQMYLRVTNIGSRTNVHLDQVQLQYWFDGPDETPDPFTRLRGDAIPFELYCSDMSTQLRGGCSSLRYAFSPGLPGVRGARYVLDLSFAPGSGALMPFTSTNSTASASGPANASASFLKNAASAAAAAANATSAATSSSSTHAPTSHVPSANSPSLDAAAPNASAAATAAPAPAAPTGATTDADGQAPILRSVEMIISIEPVAFERLDARQDYSYLATPLAASPDGSASTAPTSEGGGEGGGEEEEGVGRRVVLRERMPNTRIPAYVRGRLAWGSPPSPSPAPSPGPTSASSATTAAPTPHAPPPPPGSPPSPLHGGSLPAGSWCTPAEGQSINDTLTDGGGKGTASMACGVSRVYCCGSPGEPLATAVPPEWEASLSQAEDQQANAASSG